MTNDEQQSDEVQLISDGEGIAVLGDSTQVDRFLSSAGVISQPLDFSRKAGTILGAGAGALLAGAEVAKHSGRWVKLTEESAKAMKAGTLMKGSSTGLSRGIVTRNGKVTQVLEFVKPGSLASTLSNPAVLAGAAGIMAQMAMQQTMNEITDYLATIDEKVDDVLRAQKDSVLSQMVGAGMVIDDAMTVRAHTGRVSEVTWSKVHGLEQIIASTQAYALRQIDALAEKIEKKTKLADLVRVVGDAEGTVQEWLAVLARSFQLQEAMGILELDRVLDTSPDDIARHRSGLQTARAQRRGQISQRTTELFQRLDSAVGATNARVLLHPLKSSAAVKVGNEVAEDILVFQERLGIEADRSVLEAKRWIDAADETRVRAVETGAEGVEAIRKLGAKTFTGVQAAKGRVASEMTQRRARRHPSEKRQQETD